jgi:microcystin-dependent protein
VYLPIIISERVTHGKGMPTAMDGAEEVAVLRALMRSRTPVPLVMGDETLSVIVDDVTTGVSERVMLHTWTSDEKWANGMWLVKCVTIEEDNSTTVPTIVGDPTRLMLSGVTPPGVDLGGEGDVYIDIATKMLYGPKGPSGWGSGVSLVGPTGATGAEGAVGPAGNPPPTGAIFDYGGTTAPTGYLLCNGQTVSRVTYADLFAVIGTSFGAGDGVTTFGIPDLRGRVTVGLDNLGGSDAGRLSVANTLGGSGGAQTHTLTIAELANHNHPIANSTSHTHGPGTGTTTFLGGGSPGGLAVGFGTGVDGASTTAAGGVHAHNITAAGSDNAHNNMQPYMLLGKIIKF